MQLHNTNVKYGTISKSLHWIVGLLVIAAWILGYYAMEMLPDTSANKGTLLGLHKSVGMLVLILLIIRWSWRMYNINPSISTNNKVIATAALTVHHLLYLTLFIQTLSGWAMSSAAGYNPTFFGLFTFPGIVTKNLNMAHEFYALHNANAMVLLALFILHVCGALFHHFVLKDNTLRKMTVD